MNEVPRLRDLLDGITGRFGMEAAVSTGAVWDRWPEIVGDSIALHAEPTSLRRGVLRIRTDSPVWATEIGYLADDIRERANGVAGRELVREVRIWTSPTPVKQRARRREKSTPQEGAAAAKEPPADPISAFERARRAWLNKGAKKPS